MGQQWPAAGSGAEMDLLKEVTIIFITQVKHSMDMSLRKLGDSRQVSLVSYSPWGCKESDMTY